MRVKYLLGLPVAVFVLVPLFATAGAGSAHASGSTYTCTAEAWSGETLPAVTVEAPRGLIQAKKVARTEWRGAAKYSSIECTPA
ncbi:hypothetical protein [Nocardia huaxiensis]|uniref:Ig-like domain-containing protein n=1 Tax=Nocardia huaxiensis TaxID=2755382 RepID=A0A7D6ZB89_9NOCA|nr:hypothetical protein [Nocardia huaxiensis]QLY29538.1 hypothetical protein H0264_30455 [Nocardia huaxiensis]UFS96902.1 hypothetical protein LPY97_02925 [Nocardia huaxiensis]